LSSKKDISLDMKINREDKGSEDAFVVEASDI
jgi:hypothetical protein